MVSKAVLRYIRISPRKFRLIIPLVKGKKAEEAIAILMSVKKGASKYAIDLLRSAIANAKRVQGVDVSSLYISKLIADGGPMLKRFRAASMGRASSIRKRTSHITLELDVPAKDVAGPKDAAKETEAKKHKEPKLAKAANQAEHAKVKTAAPAHTKKHKAKE